MAYPEPIPALKAGKAKEFLERLESFKIPSAVKKLYQDARKRYRESLDR